MCCLSKKTYDETRPSDHRSRDTNQTSEEVMTRQNVYTYQTSCHCTDVPICPHKVAVLILSIPPSFSQPPWQQLLWILPLLHLPAAASSTHRQTQLWGSLLTDRSVRSKVTGEFKQWRWCSYSESEQLMWRKTLRFIYEVLPSCSFSLFPL